MPHSLPPQALRHEFESTYKAPTVEVRPKAATDSSVGAEVGRGNSTLDADQSADARQWVALQGLDESLGDEEDSIPQHRCACRFSRPLIQASLIFVFRYLLLHAVLVLKRTDSLAQERLPVSVDFAPFDTSISLPTSPGACRAAISAYLLEGRSFILYTSLPCPIRATFHEG